MVNDMFKKLGSQISKNSPTILTSLGVAGLVTTTVLAVRATPKALSIVDDLLYDKYGPYTGNKKSYSWEQISTLPKKELILSTYKCYIPSLVMGGVTIACIIGSNSINIKRNTAIASAYSIADNVLKEYQSKVIETIGENKHKKIKDEILKERMEKNPLKDNTIIMTENNEVLCYDSVSGRYFKSNIDLIRRSEIELNRRLLSEMYVSINDFYDMLNIPPIKLGDELGWDVEKDTVTIDFSSQLSEDDKPCLVLDYDITHKFNGRW